MPGTEHRQRQRAAVVAHRPSGEIIYINDLQMARLFLEGQNRAQDRFDEDRLEARKAAVAASIDAHASLHSITGLTRHNLGAATQAARAALTSEETRVLQRLRRKANNAKHVWHQDEEPTSTADEVVSTPAGSLTPGLPPTAWSPVLVPASTIDQITPQDRDEAPEEAVFPPAGAEPKPRPYKSSKEAEVQTVQQVGRVPTTQEKHDLVCEADYNASVPAEASTDASVVLNIVEIPTVHDVDQYQGISKLQVRNVQHGEDQVAQRPFDILRVKLSEVAAAERTHQQLVEELRATAAAQIQRIARGWSGRRQYFAHLHALVASLQAELAAVTIRHDLHASVA